MIGEQGNKNKICPTCGGRLKNDVATIPFILKNDTVIIVKGVPSEVCSDCHEPFMVGHVTDQVMTLLEGLKALQSEVSVVSYSPELAVT